MCGLQSGRGRTVVSYVRSVSCKMESPLGPRSHLAPGESPGAKWERDLRADIGLTPIWALAPTMFMSICYELQSSESHFDVSGMVGWDSDAESFLELN